MRQSPPKTIKDAIDEAKGIVGGEFLGEFDGLVNGDLSGDIGLIAQRIDPHAENSKVNPGKTSDIPMLELAGNEFVDVRLPLNGSPGHESWKVKVNRVLRLVPWKTQKRFGGGVTDVPAVQRLNNQPTSLATRNHVRLPVKIVGVAGDVCLFLELGQPRLNNLLENLLLAPVGDEVDDLLAYRDGLAWQQRVIESKQTG